MDQLGALVSIIGRPKSSTSRSCVATQTTPDKAHDEPALAAALLSRVWQAIAT